VVASESEKCAGPRRDGDRTLNDTAKNWHTASANDHKGSAQEGQRRGQLSEAAEVLWPTANVPDRGRESRESKDRRGAGGVDLQTTASGWPTPSAMDGHREGLANDPQHFEKRRAEKAKHGQDLHRPLGVAVNQWPTPVNADSKSVRNATAQRTPGSRFNTGETLTDATTIWQTPGAMDGGSVRRGGDRGSELLLTGQASSFTPAGSGCSPQVPESAGDGETFSTLPVASRVLNPRFVEWLMGFPPDFTALSLSGSTVSGDWATRWSRYRALLRSECSRLTRGSNCEEGTRP
jgi:hypothetical protein